jgi:hypothetical protein
MASRTPTGIRHTLVKKLSGRVCGYFYPQNLFRKIAATSGDNGKAEERGEVMSYERC